MLKAARKYANAEALLRQGLERIPAADQKGKMVRPSAGTAPLRSMLTDFAMDDRNYAENLQWSRMNEARPRCGESDRRSALRLHPDTGACCSTRPCPNCRSRSSSTS